MVVGYAVDVLSACLDLCCIMLLVCRSWPGDDFVRALEGIAGGDSTITITLILGIFAVAHSGLASLRPKVSKSVCSIRNVSFLDSGGLKK